MQRRGLLLAQAIYAMALRQGTPNGLWKLWRIVSWNAWKWEKEKVEKTGYGWTGIDEVRARVLLSDRGGQDWK